MPSTPGIAAPGRDRARRDGDTTPWVLDRTCIPAIAADGAFFPIEKMEAHRRGILHLAVSVFVFSGKELLIQRRAEGKYHCGLQWANTCCTHPWWGECLKDAAQRRLREELGISIPLAQAGVISYRVPVTQGLLEHERVQAFRGEADRTSLQLSPDPEEVRELRWASLDVLRADALARPQDFAPWFLIYLRRWAELDL